MIATHLLKLRSLPGPQAEEKSGCPGGVGFPIKEGQIIAMGLNLIPDSLGDGLIGLIEGHRFPT